ncbi:hypothetical protein FM114_11860 [Luteococcus japonicus LSP_Lj1]|uniref:Uncharacterized protein n=1 Tax=Luteococcus japonicus LSP_Lj1 TaxID=1255658 RepID=A0A1R4K6Z0_9ACTN|nr:hypothetical protein FM114_11860 [Luteococcus japonicus LSP_Lj1]
MSTRVMAGPTVVASPDITASRYARPQLDSRRMTQGPQADPARPALAQRRIMRACKIPMVGCTGIVLLALWSVVHNLVPNPLATAPGRSLAQIHQEVAAAGESLEVAVVLGISGQGIALARAALRACWRRHRRDP